jgi:hypothetical protein
MSERFTKRDLEIIAPKPPEPEVVSEASPPFSVPPGLLRHYGRELETIQAKLADSASQVEPVERIAARGTSGAGGALPHLDAIQRSFGRHDVSQIKAHNDAAAQSGTRALGAEAFASGDHVAFAGTPSLHTAAHEAAHVVQQRAGVHLKGGVGEVADEYERHADAVADRVVRGESAEALLDQMAGKSRGGAPAVQMKFAGTFGAILEHTLSPARLRAKGTFYEAMFNALKDAQEVLKIEDGSTLYDRSTKVLRINGTVVEMLSNYAGDDKAELDAALVGHIASLTHEMSHAHDHLLKNREIVASKDNFDQHIATVLDTELRAWSREAVVAAQLSKDGTSLDEEQKSLVAGWREIDSAMVHDLKGSRTNKVIQRLFDYIQMESGGKFQSFAEYQSWVDAHPDVVETPITTLKAQVIKLIGER